LTFKHPNLCFHNESFEIPQFCRIWRLNCERKYNRPNKKAFVNQKLYYEHHFITVLHLTVTMVHSMTSIIHIKALSGITLHIFPEILEHVQYQDTGACVMKLPLTHHPFLTFCLLRLRLRLFIGKSIIHWRLPHTMSRYYIFFFFQYGVELMVECLINSSSIKQEALL